MTTPLTVDELRAAVDEIRQTSARLGAQATNLASRADRDLGHDVAEVVKDLRAAARQLRVTQLLLEPARADLAA
ncbi:hypothetical protein SAMN04488564_11191 [Lentzea waywayandensis]|uniref:Uncharacterized protein n=1 Tax=Lentzea waywayandensis TaxID=84724 RepID=A0A1I6FC15_9PSEU|nr:hypothetical protein [Lentzea waywayandensis]SFR27531.1 hypothetical protein SAMN04488564_11191 [Lentzea waywayandensis]